MKKIMRKIRCLSVPNRSSAGKVFRPLRRPDRSRKAAFLVSGRGSFVVEASLALPLFLFCFLALISLMDVYRITMEKTVQLQEQAETMGALTSGLSDLTVIDLPYVGSYRPIWLFLPVSGITIRARGRVHAWSGRSEEEIPEAREGSGGSPGTLVYVTEYGEAYHTDENCSHLNISIRTTDSASVGSLRNAAGGKYHACEKCAGKGTAGPLYVTPEGDCYHTDPDCSGLTRTVRLMDAEETDLPCCKDCGGLAA